MKCTRCDKKEATKRVGVSDPDLKGIPVCEDCADNVILGLNALFCGDEKLAKQLLGKNLSKDL